MQTFKTVRSQSEDPDSLVPVGDKEEVGFVSDEVRKAILEDKILKQQRMQIKSNLKTPNDAIFGAGYLGKDGKAVVGAAHGLDEMLKMAEKSNKRYSDTSTDQWTDKQKKEKEHLDKLKLEFQMGQLKSVRSKDDDQYNHSKHHNVDRNINVSADNGPVAIPVVDLLDFGNDDDDDDGDNNRTGTEPTTASIQNQSQPEILKSPSLPYPQTKEEAYFQSEDDFNHNSSSGGGGGGTIDVLDTNGNGTMIDTGGIFGRLSVETTTAITTRQSSTTNNQENDPHEDLLNLSTPSFPPPTATNATNANTTNTTTTISMDKANYAMEDNLIGMNSLSLNSANAANSVFDAISSTNATVLQGDILNPMNSSTNISNSNNSSTNDIMGSSGGSMGGGMNMGMNMGMNLIGSNVDNLQQHNSSSAISAMDMLAPMGGTPNKTSTLSTMNENKNHRPPTPVDPPPPLPPVSPPTLPPVSPPAEPTRSSPIPMGGFASPPPPPRQSPPPMGGMPSSTKPPTPPPLPNSSPPLPPVKSTNTVNNNMVPDSSINNPNTGNMMNPMNPQQDMMMMLMNQQQQLMQSANGGGMNNNNQQTQMMQQMMMMNQQMMQQMMMMNQSGQSQPQQASLLQQQQQQQQQMMSMMMMQQQQPTPNTSNNNCNTTINGNSQENSNGYPQSMNPFS